jgi:hypothetical protein
MALICKWADKSEAINVAMIVATAIQTFSLIVILLVYRSKVRRLFYHKQSDGKPTFCAESRLAQIVRRIWHFLCKANSADTSFALRTSFAHLAPSSISLAFSPVPALRCVAARCL